MRVISFDPYFSPERATLLGIEKVELEELFSRADFISLHTPLTDATRDIINAEAITKMKRGMRIVNCARGGLIVEKDLKLGLESGQIAAAGLDVFEVEPAKKNILFGMENVVATPHLGASTTEAQEKVALQVAEQMADYLISGAVTNALNIPSVTAEEAPRLKPYLLLAKQLGSFAGQVTENALESVTIEYEGHAAELNIRPLTSIIIQGLLSPLMVSINAVNALVIAKERDIRVSEVKHERPSVYQTLIKLTVKTEKQTRSIAGTLFARSRPRIVEIKDILLRQNWDQTCYLSPIGTSRGSLGLLARP